MPGRDAVTFADRLRSHRERAGLTQQELAERAGLTPHAISALERGTRSRPYPHTVRSLAAALDLDEDERGELLASVRRRPDRRDPASVDPRSTLPVSGLDVPATHLFGRGDDVAAVVALLRDEGARLVTLVGPGGVGKTRLAAAVAEALADHFADGVVEVSLAPLRDAGDVVTAVARATAAPGEAEDTLTEHLRPRRLLLVLDNFEHLLDTAPLVGRLTARCPDLVVLATSRTPLRVRAEREYAVQPLAVPTADVRTEADLARWPSGAMALERARAVAPSVGSDPDDVVALAELCDRLAGIPLAIELAAARLRTLTPRALLARLDEALVATGARDLPERQRTMRATLDWSYRLLTPAQQQLFTLLGAFRGGAELDVVEAVATQAGEAEPAEVLGLLEELVAHSLLRVVPAAGDGPRFVMLEPVAEYARSLLQGDRAARVQLAHAAAYLRLARQAAEGYEREDQVRWLARTGAEEANLVTAVERAVALGDPDTAGVITWSLWLYWWLRGGMTVGRRLAALCLDQPLAPHVRPRVLLTAATMAYAADDYAAATAHWAEADRLGVALGDPEVLAKARAGTGLAALAETDLPGAARRFREALAFCADAGEQGVWMTSLVHVWLGTIQLLEGDAGAGTAEVHRGLAIARVRGDRLSSYTALYNLSQAALAAGDDDAARALLIEGLVLSEQTQDLANLAHFLETMAVLESRAGRHVRVATLFGAAAAIRETVGSVYGYYLPDRALLEAADSGARTALGQDAYDDAVDAGRGLEAASAFRLALEEQP